ncbi:MAG TPA: phosphate ABC transporter ATP-binding protein [Euryarchaeota archaeon]|nr:phosphate import ATP-binding protein PstB 3 [archaeon BMS3Bbin15]HDL15360.1 phosphate ABC transporter ATP-binding protein [Euryarchaeota archaeon]
MAEKIKTLELKKSYKGRMVFSNLNISICQGEAIAIVGPSGAGKSTFLRILNRLTDADSGNVFLDGTSIYEINPVSLRNRIGIVFQMPGLFDGTVEENILFGPKIRGVKHLESLKSHVLKQVGLPEEYLKREVKNLSQGEKQRVAIARALANEPEVLLMDEPTSALDPESQKIIEDLILELKRNTGITFVVATHNRAQAKRIGDKIMHLEGGRGKIVTKEEFFREEKI